MGALSNKEEQGVAQCSKFAMHKGFIAPPPEVA